ncbi:MAG TPA: hypothetical protein VNZ45_03005, partial [Bacteroidia bacterium]|nr:hypothetical protein [Bacteroidia bacterium]
MKNNSFLMNKNHHTLLLLVVGLLFSINNAGAQKHHPGYAQEKWKVKDPFEQKVFIENNEGQFDGLGAGKDDKVLFSSSITGVQVYLTSSGIIYRYTKYPETTQKDAEEERGKEVPHESYIYKELWVGANKSPEVLAKDEVSFYYCYPQSCKHTTIAHAFRKLLYKN